MVCTDSMHSKLKVNEKYADINESMIQHLYGVRVSDKAHHMWEARKSAPVFFDLLRNTLEKDYKELNSINLTQFYIDTTPLYYITHCHMQGKGCFKTQNLEN